MPTSATPAGAGAGPARAASSPTSSYLSVPSSGTASGASSGHHHSNSTGDIGISSPVHADEAAATKLSFFGALKKKLKGNKQQAKQVRTTRDTRRGARETGQAGTQTRKRKDAHNTSE